MNNKNHPMWNHINAPLEEKVEILAQNPYRFYIGQNVWALRNSRQEILQEYLKEAIAKENFELCQKIREVKTFISFVNNQHTNNVYLFLLETVDTNQNVKIRYYLKKEDNLLNLCTTSGDHKKLNDCKEHMELNDYLNKKDVMQLIERFLKRQEIEHKKVIFRNVGFLDEKDFRGIVDSIKEKKRTSQNTERIKNT